MTVTAEPPQSSTETRAAMKQLGERLSEVWPIPLIAGLVSIGLGLAIMATDWTVHALVIVVGLLLVLRGLTLVFSPLHAANSAGEQIVAGILGIVGGVILIAWPQPTLLVLAFGAGAWIAASGVFHIVVALARRSRLPHWGAALALGVIELPLGVWMMRRPDVTVNLVITVIGLWAVLGGVVLCVQAFEIRNRAKRLREAAVTGSPATTVGSTGVPPSIDLRGQEVRPSGAPPEQAVRGDAGSVR